MPQGQSLFYTQDQEETPNLHLPASDTQAEQNSPFVVPFQRSAAMLTLTDDPAHRAQTPTSSPPTLPASRLSGIYNQLVRPWEMSTFPEAEVAGSMAQMVGE